MKKLISIIGCALPLAGFAQVHTSQDFLNVPAVVVTNTFNITNLNLVTVVWKTNQVGTQYSNIVNNTLTLITATNGNAVNLLGTASLWTDRNGLPVGANWLTNNQAAATLQLPVVANISGKVFGTSASFTPISFTFAPVPASDGTHNPDKTTMLTDAAAEWTFSVTLQGAGQVNFCTNVPTWLWPGMRGLTCKRIVNGTNGAASAIQVSDLQLNGFVP